MKRPEEKRKNGVSPMATARITETAGISGENSGEKPAKKRGRTENLIAHQFNPSGRPKGTTAKEMLRRQINRTALGLDGKPSKDGIVRGDILSNVVVTRAIAGDMRAMAIVFQYDQDRPNGIGQGEQVPATVQVNVNANAEASAQAAIIERDRGPGLEARLCEIYGLDYRARERAREQEQRFSTNG
jgi:hypothetical protein